MSATDGGGGPRQVEGMEAQLQVANGALAAVQGVLADIAEQIALAALTGFANWVDQAANPRSPRQLRARVMCGQLTTVLDRARAVRSGIELPGEGPAPSNGGH